MALTASGQPPVRPPTDTATPTVNATRGRTRAEKGHHCSSTTKTGWTRCRVDTEEKRVLAVECTLTVCKQSSTSGSFCAAADCHTVSPAVGLNRFGDPLDRHHLADDRSFPTREPFARRSPSEFEPHSKLAPRASTSTSPMHPRSADSSGAAGPETRSWLGCVTARNSRFPNSRQPRFTINPTTGRTT